MRFLGDDLNVNMKLRTRQNCLDLVGSQVLLEELLDLRGEAELNALGSWGSLSYPGTFSCKDRWTFFWNLMDAF